MDQATTHGVHMSGPTAPPFQQSASSLMLRVSVCSEIKQEARLRDGITIGSFVDSSIRIADSAVKPEHAVIKLIDGQYILQCLDGATAVLSTSDVTEIRLVPGTTFWIGFAMFQCLEGEPIEPPEYREPPLTAPPKIEPRAGCCPKCGRDLAARASAARYCPSCGQQLFMNNGCDDQTALGGSLYSRMLRGFSSALYRMGWRYEVGAGSLRSVREAIRCYFKAARMGNVHARNRLEARGVPKPNSRS